MKQKLSWLARLEYLLASAFGWNRIQLVSARTFSDSAYARKSNCHTIISWHNNNNSCMLNNVYHKHVLSWTYTQNNYLPGTKIPCSYFPQLSSPWISKGGLAWKSCIQTQYLVTLAYSAPPESPDGLPSWLDVHCPVCRGRLSKRFRAKNRLSSTSHKSNVVFDEVLICLCIWTVKLESLDWWVWCDLGGGLLPGSEGR